MAPRLNTFFAIGLYLAIVLSYGIMALHYPVAYIWATFEDMYGEWAQTYLFVLAGIFACVHAIRIKRYRLFFIVVAVLCLYAVGEEISWGQRLFGWESPNLFQRHNFQGETNLHNFVTGPHRTWVKVLIERALAAALASYGLIYPWALQLNYRWAIRLDATGIAPPPLSLWPMYVTAALCELSIAKLNEAEVAELLIGLAMMLTVIKHLYASRLQLEALDQTSWQTRHRLALTSRFAVTVAFVVGFSYATTATIYSGAQGKIHIDDRVWGGIEKHAGIYAYHQMWEQAISLYQRVHQVQPDNIGFMLDLAKCYAKNNDPENSEIYLQKVLISGLLQLDHDPNVASTRRTLAETYAMLGQDEKAVEHFTRALQIDYGQLKSKPNDAATVYSLGITLYMLGKDQEASRYLARAVELEPTSKLFRGAYYKFR